MPIIWVPTFWIWLKSCTCTVAVNKKLTFRIRTTIMLCNHSQFIVNVASCGFEVKVCCKTVLWYGIVNVHMWKWRWFTASTRSGIHCSTTSKATRHQRLPNCCREENLQASQVGIAKFVKKYEQTGSISRSPGSGHPSRITAEVREAL